jgi:acyl transferase domain-containing protein
MGPGDALTRLNREIVPASSRITGIPAPRGPVSTSAPAGPAQSPGSAMPVGSTKKIIFMYGGQGSQYYGMGRDLYSRHPVFRAALDRCDAIYAAITGRSLAGEIYDGGKESAPFDDVSFTHSAIFAVSYSMTEALRAEGVHPDGVLGQSMGEYNAAVTAGLLSVEDAMRLVTEQGRIARRGGRGGLMCVLTDPAIMTNRHDLFRDTQLTGINSSGNFVVGGEKETLNRLWTDLRDEGIVAVMMPVNCAFHTTLLDEVRGENLELAATIQPGRPRLPIYSSMAGGLLDGDLSRWWDGWVWGVIRDQVGFSAVMASHFRDPDDYLFVDITASSVFTNILKWGYGPGFRCFPTMNRKGDDLAALARAGADLRAAGSRGPEARVAQVV